MIKQVMKRIMSLLLATALLFGLLPVITEDLILQASAAQIDGGSGTWISGKLTYTYVVNLEGSTGSTTNGAAGSVSVSGSTLTVKAVSSEYVSEGCSETEAYSTTTTVTVTNASSYPLRIDSLSDPSAVVKGVAQGQSIAAGATFTIEITANPNSKEDKSSRTATGAVTISVTEETTATITLVPSPYVSYTVNGHTVQQSGSSVSFTANFGDTISLPSVTAPEGYQFKGWRIGSEPITTATSFTVAGSREIYPVIISGEIQEGPNFKVGSNTYTFWEEAMSAAVNGSNKKVIVNQEIVTLPDSLENNILPSTGGAYVKPTADGGVEYLIPGGVSLLVPFDAAGTAYTTTPAVVYNSHTNPTAFHTLVMPNGTKITVQSGAALNLSGKLSSSGQMGGWNGTPTGPDGRINMKAGSAITLENGANLYCWGYIYGSGSVEAKSGSTVYEAFQIKDWRGGTATSNVYTYAFIFSQYYIQNIEVPLKLNAGAAEKLYSAVNAQSSAHPISAAFLGSGGMFTVSSGYIVKDYVETSDRLHIEVNGNVSVSPMTISGIPMVGSISTDSYNLPINGNIGIDLLSGTTTVTQNIELLPGTEINVGRNATMQINSGKKVYVYDESDWGKFTGSARLYPIGYSVANGTTAIRTDADLKDARINVNGTVTVAGSLFTSVGGADLVSTLGTEGSSGKLVFSTAPTATATVYEMEGNSTKTAVSFTAPKLRNGDETYSATVGTGKSTWYYDKDGEHWYRYLVDFVYNGQRIARDYYCENNATLTYDASWLTDLGASVTSGTATASVSGTNVNVTNVTADATITLTGNAAQFIPVFLLNEKQYQNYRFFTGNTLSETRTINEETWYVAAKADAALAVGTAYAAPTDAFMGVSTTNHNEIVWNLTGISATSGRAYNGFVPAGESAGGEAYIYGFYIGAVAYNSYTDQYYSTLAAAMDAVSQNGPGTVRLIADCGSFEDEPGTTTYAVLEGTDLTLDLNGYKALGCIINAGNLTLELNGGTWDYHTGTTAAASAYRTKAAIVNNGKLTLQDTACGGKLTTDLASDSGGVNHGALIRNDGGSLCIDGTTLEMTQMYNANNAVLMNYNGGTVTSLSNATLNSGYGYGIFNYGAAITEITGTTMTGSYGINNRNLRGSNTIAVGYNISQYGTIGTIANTTISVGQYAIYNGGTIDTLSGSTFVAHPDSAQVDTLENGTTTARHGNVQGYAVYNSSYWWYDTNVWKRVDSTSGGYTRVDYYKEDEACRPTIGTITDCEIYAENTSNSASYGYALVNYGVIGTIGGTTNIKTYKHPDNTKISTSHYAMNNLGGGIIKSIEGTVNVSATGVGTVYNDGVFTTQIDYTYGNKVAGNVTHQYSTYGQPSTILSITCDGTWTCGSYYALMNSGYIQTINAPGLTLSGSTASYNVLYNATGGSNSSFDYTRYYTDVATAGTEYRRVAVYIKNMEKGSTIGTINGITLVGKYNVLNNQGHIGTLSNVTVSNSAASNDPTFLNGDSRYATVTEDRQTNRTPDTDPHLTVSSGIVTRYDREYTYDTPTIDVIDNLTVNSTGQYAFRNAGSVGTLKNSTLTATTTATTSYALHNSASGPYTERQTLQYYSGTSIFATTKYPSEYVKHYKRNPANITTIDNCTIKTNTSSYAALNVGHIGTIKNSTFQAGATTAAAYALANLNSQEREYTRNLEEIMYVTANGATACTAYWGSGGETNVVTYDYDCPTIDLIGEGNTFLATTTVIANSGIITEINSDTGAVTTITGSAAKGSSIYNYSACLDARTTTTPYTAAASASASGTAGKAVNSDTLLAGAQIGTIKNVYINANGYGILNGDATTGKQPTIGEIGEGTEISAHCTTAGYHAIYNQANAKITSITGGIFTVTKATTNAYKNNNTNTELATLISGGDFKGSASTRANAIFEPDNTSRQTYPAGKNLSTDTESVTLHDGSTGTGYYYVGESVTVTFNANGGAGTMTEQTFWKGKEAALTRNAFNRTGYEFSGWNTKADGSGTAYADQASVTLTESLTLYAQWIKLETAAVSYSFLPFTVDLNDVWSGIHGIEGLTGLNGTVLTVNAVPAEGGLQFTATVNGEASKLTLTFTPGQEVYIEETSGFLTYAGTWASVTDGAAVTAAANGAPGYDGSYAASTGIYSGGTARKVTVSDGNGANTVSFTFTGTGFQVYTETSNESGTVRVQIKQGGTVIRSKVVQLYRGYAPDDSGEWQPTDSYEDSVYYAVPAIREEVPYGTYDVTLTPIYYPVFDLANKGEFTFIVDAVKILNPANTSAHSYKSFRKAVLESGNLGAAEQYDTTGKLYLNGTAAITAQGGIWNDDDALLSVYFFNSNGTAWADCESADGGSIYWTRIPSGFDTAETKLIIVRADNQAHNFDSIWDQTGDIAIGTNLDSGKNYIETFKKGEAEAVWGSYQFELPANGGALIDGKGTVGSDGLEDLEKFGPKYQLYLDGGQALIFTADAAADWAVGAKALNGATGLQIYEIEEDGTAAELLNTALRSYTELFYKLNRDPVSGRTVLIYNAGENPLSLTELRTDSAVTLQFTAEALRTATRALKALQDGTLDVVDPTEPEDPPMKPDDPTEPEDLYAKFTDLKQAWYTEGVRYVLESGLMYGVAEDRFDPMGNVTRGQLVTILYRHAQGRQLVETPEEITFSDVKPEKFYTNAVHWAAANGIVSGYPDGTFRPDRALSRQELVSILYRYAGGTAPETDPLSDFADRDTVAQYARPALAWAVEQGVIYGTASGGRTLIDPSGTATRAQIAAILFRARTLLASDRNEE